MTKPQQQAHTPGPLWSVEPRGNLKARQFVEAGEFRIAEFITRDQTYNARLAVATVNSYDKHCGPRAVECAEADLLGEALAIVAGLLPYAAAVLDVKAPPKHAGAYRDAAVKHGATLVLTEHLKRARAVLAKASGEAKAGGS